MGFERADVWTNERMTEEFQKWQAMHRESLHAMSERQFTEVEQRLVGLERSVGELKGLQT